MTFEKTRVDGAFLIRPQPRQDERGFFARVYCVNEFRERGLDLPIVQRSISFNRSKGTLRGMHFQVAPYPENKLVSCTRGAIFDVVLDLRPTSATYGTWFGATLTAEGLESMYVPAGCAHGFITLATDTIVAYEISEFHHPECARGVRFDDPAFCIEWPSPPSVINARDLSYPDYTASREVDNHETV
jgi:dTDP-4-dehydrorhamnose 3,5-epimerase